MRITLNGEPVSMPEPRLTLSELLQHYPPAHRGYAVEVNGAVTTRRDHDRIEIREGDRIEVVTLVGGG